MFSARSVSVASSPRRKGRATRRKSRTPTTRKPSFRRSPSPSGRSVRSTRSYRSVGSSLSVSPRKPAIRTGVSAIKFDSLSRDVKSIGRDLEALRGGFETLAEVFTEESDASRADLTTIDRDCGTLERAHESLASRVAAIEDRLATVEDVSLELRSTVQRMADDDNKRGTFLELREKVMTNARQVERLQRSVDDLSAKAPSDETAQRLARLEATVVGLEARRTGDLEVLESALSTMQARHDRFRRVTEEALTNLSADFSSSKAWDAAVDKTVSHIASETAMLKRSLEYSSNPQPQPPPPPPSILPVSSSFTPLTSRRSPPSVEGRAPPASVAASHYYTPLPPRASTSRMKVTGS